MKIVSLFNNKGGVGKTTLAYHTACSFAEMKKKVLMIDLDPQCNLTVYAMGVEKLHTIWEEEDAFIDGFEQAKKKNAENFGKINNSPRSIHYLLKPTEEGTGELETLPPVVKIRRNLDLIPGRLTLYKYENKISERWPSAYQGDPLAIRTITKIRSLANDYSEINNYDIVLIDTSPSLGALNKVIISTVDGFIIPCLPDMFSLYGIRNIGNSLSEWKEELEIIYRLISEEKRKSFPKNFVQFLGYTIYNARRYQQRGKTENPWNLAVAHLEYAKQIPTTIKTYIKQDLREPLDESLIEKPIGDTAVMHSHNTFTEHSQKYHLPIWDVPHAPDLNPEDKSTILGNRTNYEKTKQMYQKFSQDLLKRLERLDGEL